VNQNHFISGKPSVKRDFSTACPHHWVTPFLGKRGQISLSRHNFASTAPFPDLSTPLDSLYYSGSDGGLGVEIGAVSGRQLRKNGM